MRDRAGALRSGWHHRRSKAIGWRELFGEGIAAAATFILVLLFLVFLAFPLLAAVIEVTLVLLLATAGVIGRVLLWRPWTIEARASDGTTREWRVPGWRDSGERRKEVERQLTTGHPLSPLHGTAASRL